MNVERTCIVCRNKFNQNNLHRIVLKSNCEVILQTDKKLEGRGAYICKNHKCIENLIKSKALNKTFKKNIDNSQYENLINSLKD